MVEIKKEGFIMVIKKFELGSNQYKTRIKKNSTALSNLRLFILGVTAITSCTLFSMIDHHTFNGSADAPTHFKLLNPMSQKADAEMLPDATPTPTEHELIVKEIDNVFGNYAPKAYQLLNCENHALNPLVVNDNTTWGGVGRDIGIFQINTKWQGVSNEAFLRDYHINIRIAWNIFSRDGYSFKLWTCGKKLNI